MWAEYKEIAEKIDPKELESFYYSHLPKDTRKHFNIQSRYLLYKVLEYFNIPPLSKREIRILQKNFESPEARATKIAKLRRKNTGQKRSEESRARMRAAQAKLDHSNLIKIGEASRFKKGRTPWNKGKHGVQPCKKETIAKRQQTMRERGTFNSSKQEDAYYASLCEVYGENNIERQYMDDRYPFKCDFYIKSEDLFIELNKCWTHGGRPFDSDDLECLNKLALWEEKSKTSKFYKIAIYTWTDLDVRKSEIARANNLNYKIIY